MGYMLLGLFIGMAAGYFLAALMFIASKDSRAREGSNDSERISVTTQEDEA